MEPDVSSFLLSGAAPLLCTAALVWLLVSAILAARPVKGTAEWIHRTVSPSFFTTADLGIAGWPDYIMAVAAAAAAFVARLAFCVVSVGFRLPETAVILRCVGIALGTGVAYYVVSQITDSRRNAWFAAVAAFCLLIQSDSQALLTMLCPAFLALAPVNPVFFPVFGLFAGVAAVTEPGAIWIVVPGLTTAILVQATGKRPSAILLWLLGMVVGAGVYVGLSLLSSGSLAWPVLGLSRSVSCSVTAAAAAVCTIVYLAIRIGADRRFSDVFLLQALVFSLPCLLAGIDVVWIFSACAVGTAAHAIRSRGSAPHKASLVVFCCILAAVLAVSLAASLIGKESAQFLIRGFLPVRYLF